MNVTSITQFLSKVELFHGIAEEDLALFAAHAQCQQPLAGDILFRSNDLTDSSYGAREQSLQEHFSLRSRPRLSC